MAEYTGSQNFVPEIQSPDTHVSQLQTFSATPTLETQYNITPTIQNVPYAHNVVYAQQTQPQFVYTQTQPQIVTQNDSITRTLAMAHINDSAEEIKRLKGELLKKNNETSTQKSESTTVSNINNKIHTDAEKRLEQTYEDYKQAQIQQQKDNEDLKEQVKTLTKQLEENNNAKIEEERMEEIRSEFQDRMDALQDEKDILIQQQEEFKKQQNAPEDFEKILQDQNNLQANKVEQVANRCKKAEADLSKLVGELTSTESKINTQNESMGLFKKFLIAIGLSNEPEKLIKLREKVHEISEKIEKQKDKVEKNKNILTNEEDNLLQMVETNMEKINEFKKKSIEEKETEIQRQIAIQKEIREDKELQNKEKTFLKKQAGFEIDMKDNYIEKLRMDGNNRKEIDAEIRKQDLHRYKQRTINFGNKVTSLKDVNKAKAKGRFADFY